MKLIQVILISTGCFLNQWGINQVSGISPLFNTFTQLMLKSNFPSIQQGPCYSCVSKPQEITISSPGNQGLLIQVGNTGLPDPIRFQPSSIVSLPQRFWPGLISKPLILPSLRLPTPGFPFPLFPINRPFSLLPAQPEKPSKPQPEKPTKLPTKPTKPVPSLPPVDEIVPPQPTKAPTESPIDATEPTGKPSEINVTEKPRGDSGIHLTLNGTGSISGTSVSGLGGSSSIGTGTGDWSAISWGGDDNLFKGLKDAGSIPGSSLSGSSEFPSIGTGKGDLIGTGWADNDDWFGKAFDRFDLKSKIK